MKTTIDMDNDLLVAARKAAIDEHNLLRALIEQGLRLRLAAKTGGHTRRIRWVVAKGGAPSEVRDRDTMYEWVRKTNRHAPWT
jgi:hypothetical protein